MIEVQDISKQYGQQVVLDGVSLRFDKGKMISLIGSNGAGKSTLLSIIGRLLDQNRGVVLLDDKNIREYKNRLLARRMAVLKQSNHLQLKLTVRELVAFGRFPYSQDKLTAADNEQVEKAIRFLDLKEIENAYIDELSGGQRQRAYMAMVVAQDSQYLLLDEPLNNLDMKHSVQIMQTLRRLAETFDKTIIIVLHDINFASYYSDYILALKNGKVMYYDKTERIINEQVLEDIFDIRFNIMNFNGKKLCNFFEQV